MSDKVVRASTDFPLRYGIRNLSEFASSMTSPRMSVADAVREASDATRLLQPVAKGGK